MIDDHQRFRLARRVMSARVFRDNRGQRGSPASPAVRIPVGQPFHERPTAKPPPRKQPIQAGTTARNDQVAVRIFSPASVVRATATAFEPFYTAAKAIDGKRVFQLFFHGTFSRYRKYTNVQYHSQYDYRRNWQSGFRGVQRERALPSEEEAAEFTLGKIRLQPTASSSGFAP